MKRDAFGKMAADALNHQAPDPLYVQHTRYIPHLGRLVTQTEQANRLQILQENAMLYHENRKRGTLLQRKEFAGSYPMRIPELDLVELRKRNPELRLDADKETRRRAMIKLYKAHKEYRIG